MPRPDAEPARSDRLYKDRATVIDWASKREYALTLPQGRVSVFFGIDPDEEAILPDTTLRVVRVKEVAIINGTTPRGGAELGGSFIVLQTQAGTEKEENTGKDGSWTADASLHSGFPIRIPDIVQGLQDQYGVAVDIVAACSGLPRDFYPFAEDKPHSILFTSVSHEEGFASGIQAVVGPQSAVLTMQIPQPKVASNVAQFAQAKWDTNLTAVTFT